MAGFTRWGVGVAGAVLLAALVTQRPLLLGEEEKVTVQALLPGEEEVGGWSVVEGSRTYCPTPDTLPDIYDGGYGYYVDAGVLQAVVQAYGSNGNLVLVYVHEMTSLAQAKAICDEFYESLKDGSSSLRTLEIKDGGFVTVGAGQASGYLWRDRFYCNVVSSGEEEKNQEAVMGFLAVVGEKIGSGVGGEKAVPVAAGGGCAKEKEAGASLRAEMSKV